MKLEQLKNNTKAIFACVTGAIAFLYIFVTLLICGFGGGSSFWISFVFALISIALAGYVSYHSVKAAKKLTDWIFSLPVLRWCLIYVAAEIVLSTVFMIVSAPWKLVFLLQLLFPILFLILVVPCFFQKSHVAEVNHETRAKVSYIRQMYAKVIALIPRAEDPDVKKELEKAADMLRHSDPMSADSLAELEEKIVGSVSALDTLIRASDWNKAALEAKELCLLIGERNQLVIAAKITQY